MKRQPKGKVTLKLDASWKPIAVIDSYKGFTMCYADRAKPVRYYDEIYPSVIVLHSYVCKMPFILNCTRKNVFWRDNNICQYCNSKNNFMTIDHIIPKDKGGRDSWDNLVAACVPCNTKKGNKLLKDIDMVLLKKPKAPSFLFNIQNDLSNSQDSWKPYLFMKGKN